MTNRKYRDDEKVVHIGELSTRTAFALSRKGLTTIGKLRAWVAAGNRPVDIRGIGSLGARDIATLLEENPAS